MRQFNNQNLHLVDRWINFIPVSSIWQILYSLQTSVPLARSVRSFFYRFRYRLDKSIKIAGLFLWDVYIIFFFLLQNLNPYFQNGGQKTKMAAKNRETNITGLIIDLKSRVICQNVRCLNVYLIWPLNAILIILIWPQKSKMAAQNCKTNITWLVINLRSRVICQNVCFLYIYIYIPIHYYTWFLWFRYCHQNPKWPPKTVKQT